MRFTCENCGAQLFDNERDLDKALGSGRHSVKCKYCGEFNEFDTGGARHIDLGYDYLSSADFHKAGIEFNDAIGQGESIYAYLGLALAKYGVQTVFPNDREHGTEMPQLICHSYRNYVLSDDTDFTNALRCIGKLQSGIQIRERHRLDEYAKIVDGVREHYLRLSERYGDKFRYSAFIAYEDEKSERGRNIGFDKANDVRNFLLDHVDNVYVPDLEACGNDKIKYEAEILFALDRSECMIVITDDSIDARLQRLYARYYKKKYNSERTLAFVKYMNIYSAHLPSGQDASNVFDISDEDGYGEYVCGINHRIYKRKSKPIVKPPVITVPSHGGASETPPDEINIKKIFDFTDTGMLKFGSFPQDRSTKAEVKAAFNKFPKPTLHCDNGWNKLYKNAWYRDETVDGKKYRAVYFLQLRAPFSSKGQKSDVSAQVSNGYSRGQAYFFAFSPIYWKNITTDNGTSKTFVADRALFSREFYSDTAFEPTLYGWLDKDFANTAFTEDELKELCVSSNGRRVFVPAQDEELKSYLDRSGVIIGSDYMQCVGGTCIDRVAKSFWVTDDKGYMGRAAYSNGNVSDCAADSTTVAVIPKIILRVD